MSTAFIPTTPAAADQIVHNDGWYPDLSVSEMKARTGLGEVFGSDRVAAAIQAALIDVNAGIIGWRAVQTAPDLAGVSPDTLGDQPVKVILYTDAVYCRARAGLLNVTRDYDSTKSGHDRAALLESTADHWMERSNVALARLTGRARMVVELI